MEFSKNDIENFIAESRESVVKGLDLKSLLTSAMQQIKQKILEKPFEGCYSADVYKTHNGFEAMHTLVEVREQLRNLNSCANVKLDQYRDEWRITMHISVNCDGEVVK